MPYSAKTLSRCDGETSFTTSSCATAQTCSSEAARTAPGVTLRLGRTLTVVDAGGTLSSRATRCRMVNMLAKRPLSEQQIRMRLQKDGAVPDDLLRERLSPIFGLGARHEAARSMAVENPRCFYGPELPGRLCPRSSPPFPCTRRRPQDERVLFPTPVHHLRQGQALYPIMFAILHRSTPICANQLGE